MIYFHGTNADFFKFETQYLGAREDTAVNSYLGVWLSDGPEIPARFGRYVLAVKVPSENLELFSIDDFSRLHRAAILDDDGGISRIKAFAEAKIAEGVDVLAIEELDGSTPTLVALKPHTLTIVDRVSSSDKDALRQLLEKYQSHSPVFRM